VAARPRRRALPDDTRDPPPWCREQPSTCPIGGCRGWL
ncbi:MAG: hypothetical protein AVDCRST_MAG59-540, partial [uncultured Thermomicrobiales bacterium]